MSLEKAGQWVFMRTELGEVSHGPSWWDGLAFVTTVLIQRGHAHACCVLANFNGDFDISVQGSPDVIQETIATSAQSL